MQSNWLKIRREKVGLTQEELAAQLQLEGFEITRGAISQWENNGYKPPLKKPEFRKALAKILKTTPSGLLKMAGYETADEYSEVAQQAADIVDQLSPDKQAMALGILEQILRAS